MVSVHPRRDSTRRRARSRLTPVCANRPRFATTSPAALTAVSYIVERFPPDDRLVAKPEHRRALGLGRSTAGIPCDVTGRRLHRTPLDRPGLLLPPLLRDRIPSLPGDRPTRTPRRSDSPFACSPAASIDGNDLFSHSASRPLAGRSPPRYRRGACASPHAGLTMPPTQAGTQGRSRWPSPGCRTGSRVAGPWSPAYDRSASTAAQRSAGTGNRSDAQT
jgi:hypothetical protein